MQVDRVGAFGRRDEGIHLEFVDRRKLDGNPGECDQRVDQRVAIDRFLSPYAVQDFGGVDRLDEIGGIGA